MDFTRRLRSEQVRVAYAARWWILAYLVADSGMFIYLDIFHYDEDGPYAIAGLAAWALGYAIFIGALQTAGYLKNGKESGVGTYFLLGIAMGIPVLLAMIAFIIPGLYLLMRWLPVFCRALLSKDDIWQAMRWSWTETQPHQKALSIAMLGPVAMTVITIGMNALYGSYYEFLDWNHYYVLTFAANITTSVAVAWFTVLGIATFGCLIDDHEDSAHVDTA